MKGHTTFLHTCCGSFGSIYELKVCVNNIGNSIRKLCSLLVMGTLKHLLSFVHFQSWTQSRKKIRILFVTMLLLAFNVHSPGTWVKDVDPSLNFHCDIILLDIVPKNYFLNQLLYDFFIFTLRTKWLSKGREMIGLRVYEKKYKGNGIRLKFCDEVEQSVARSDM